MQSMWWKDTALHVVEGQSSPINASLMQQCGHAINVMEGQMEKKQNRKNLYKS